MTLHRADQQRLNAAWLDYLKAKRARERAYHGMYALACQLEAEERRLHIELGFRHRDLGLDR